METFFWKSEKNNTYYLYGKDRLQKPKTLFSNFVFKELKELYVTIQYKAV